MKKIKFICWAAPYTKCTMIVFKFQFFSNNASLWVLVEDLWEEENRYSVSKQIELF